ncbi:hypothetical protein N8445_00405 [bacterium]|jgi:hypothetical protein|nr:hypothetical protein [bacterium]
MLKVDFIYYSDEWNQEKPTTNSTHLPRMEGSIENAHSGSQ